MDRFAYQKDELHEKVTETTLELRRQAAQLITTDLILIEFLNAHSSVKFRSQAISFADILLNLSNVEIIANNPKSLE